MAKLRARISYIRSNGQDSIEWNMSAPSVHEIIGAQFAAGIHPMGRYRAEDREGNELSIVTFLNDAGEVLVVCEIPSGEPGRWDLDI